MSTSCQLAFSVNNNDLVPLVADSTCPVQYFPYFENSYLAIAASLNGGNVLTHFVAMLQQWLSCFGKINFDSVITYNTYKPCFVEVESSNDIILSDCRLMPTQQFFSYIMARTS